MRCPRRPRSSRPGLTFWFVFASTCLVAGTVQAFPGQAVRLGGVQAQGPASFSVTGLHHNPAMLAAMRGSAFQVSLAGGLEQQWVRRTPIDPDSGAPQGGLQSPTSLLQPSLGYFAGLSFFFDPVALGVGIYDLGSRYRVAAADPVRYHLAPNPDPGCLRLGPRRCPPKGGALTYRHDVTLALAYDGGPFAIGAGVHFPLVRERFAFDNDATLGAQSSPCSRAEDPRCAERIGFKGWTRWIPVDGGPSGFDTAVTIGIAFQLPREFTLGARYRTFPLRRLGRIVLDGSALVCQPSPGPQAPEGGIPSCDRATPIRATLWEHLPQEVALGASMVFGRLRGVHVDLNLYWLDLCPGGPWGSRCGGQGAQTLRLVGLDRRAFVLPEFDRYRGLQDLFGLDAYVSYKASAKASVLAAGHLSSPPTRRGATTAALSDGTRVGLSAGARLRVRGRSRISLLLTPGYGLDISLPRRVTPTSARFSPEAAHSFAAAGGDLNAPGAQAVLDGRGRPTNAGRYFGLLHTFTLAVSWGDALED